LVKQRVRVDRPARDISATNLPAGFPVSKGNTKLEAALSKSIDEFVADGTWLKLYQQLHPGYPKPELSLFGPTPIRWPSSRLG
jgi:ABC-type amino acid transport substrate-binding protein